MALSKPADRLNKKQDLIHLVILLAVALAIGIYLITTTTLISKDGTSYIVPPPALFQKPLQRFVLCFSCEKTGISAEMKNI